MSILFIGIGFLLLIGFVWATKPPPFPEYKCPMCKVVIIKKGYTPTTSYLLHLSYAYDMFCEKCAKEEGKGLIGILNKQIKELK